MDLADFLLKNWRAFATAPAAFVAFGIVVAAVAVVITRAVMGGALEAARERLAAARDDLQRTRSENRDLLARLEQHGEDIAQIRRELDAVPRIIVSETPPTETRPHIWVQTSGESK